MAEVVAEMQERILPEYEQLKKFKVCTDEQIRDCIRRRESLQLKITSSQKSITSYLDFIVHEKKVHKWVTEKEKILGHKLAGIKASIATRIIRLYREGLRKYPHEERLWNHFLYFSKKSVPHEVAGIYEKMLTYHGDKPDLWCDAALWTYEYSLNLPRVKEIFLRGLQRHPSSERLNKTFFDILLRNAYNMNKERNLANNTISDQDIGIEQVAAVYRNSKPNISNIDYFLQLLQRCEEPDYCELTPKLQRIIIDDLLAKFSRDEALWNALAQRELRGFNMGDLHNLENTLIENVATREREHDTVNNDGEENIKVELVNLDNIWQKRTLKRRIELCCKVYEAAIETLGTPRMWTLYINAMLQLNQDMTTQPSLKRKQLAAAFKSGHESTLMSIEHYCTYVSLLFEVENGTQIADAVLSEAVNYQNSVKLYQLWLGIHIADNNEPKVYEIFREAHNKLGAESLPIWQRTIQFYKSRFEEDDNDEKLIQIYREACLQTSPELVVLRSDYLQYCAIHTSIGYARTEYSKLMQMPPSNLEIHRKMAELECNQMLGKSNQTLDDLRHWRTVYENMAYHFGKTSPQVWIDYILFERDNGDPKDIPLLHQRARETLAPEYVDQFICLFTLKCNGTWNQENSSDFTK